MKTRIKVEEIGNGGKIYYPQYKKSFWSSWCSIFMVCYSFYYQEKDYTVILEEAQKAIDNKLKKERERIQDQLDHRVVKTTYVKYP